MKMEFKYLETNGIQLHTALAGPEDGPPIYLLHGFPDAWFGWESQIEPLVEAGFRVIVPDQRGYNLSDKPKGVSNYKMSVLAKDVLGLADALGYEKFHVAGHDFGAMVTWHLARYHPQRIKRMVIANVPHPVVMQNFLRSNFSQVLKSWYAIFFQLPWLPEWAVKRNNYWFLMNAMPGNLSDEERSRYATAWGQPGAMTSMINWYRASLRSMGSGNADSKVSVPTLIVWGKQDPHLSYEMAVESVEYCTDVEMATFDEASHWVIHDKPKEVSQLMIKHFSAE